MKVLLVSTNHDPELWIVPGGGVEPAEDMQEAAVREVLEEAGVKGTISACLGLFEVGDVVDGIFSENISEYKVVNEILVCMSVVETK